MPSIVGRRSEFGLQAVHNRMEDKRLQPLIIDTEPRPEDIRALEEGLYQFNVEATGISDGKLFGLFLRSSDGTAIGGANGWTWGATCYLRNLFVPAHLRGLNWGTRRMADVEAEARARGCRQIVLETHSFQSPGFYRKLGFEFTGRVEHYPAGHSYLTMVKRLHDR
jgi:ribosomal protein S18 acetylase RimI-like enzyme